MSDAPHASEWPPAEPGEGLQADDSNPAYRELPDGTGIHHPDDTYGPPAPMAHRGGHTLGDDKELASLEDAGILGSLHDEEA